MDRPKLRPVERVRVELRLPPSTARELYRYASNTESTLSDAGAALINVGLRLSAARAEQSGTTDDVRQQNAPARTIEGGEDLR